ncbi:major capsid protein [Microviridae sp.]|nr:major capsid protein [Microviridae sp.]
MGRSTTNTQHSFSNIPNVSIPRSLFNRSHGVKSTMDFGILYPILVDELVPGDTVNLRLHTFARLATPLYPLMDNMYMDTHFFAVPQRLLWYAWNKLNGEQVNPGDSTDVSMPTVTAGGSGFGEGTIYDYMGLPTDVAGLTVNSLPLRGYNAIYNEWFRDQNQQTRANGTTLDGPDLPSIFELKKRNKRPDYFSTALPWPQKGDAVTLPLGTTAPVIPSGDGIPHFSDGTNTFVFGGDNAAYPSGTTWREGVQNAAPQFPQNTDAEWSTTALDADLSAATAATINQLRQAFAVQRLFERDAVGGTRYTEIVKAHFGVDSPDQRLQRPEFIGGGTQSISITPVPQTSSSASTPQGNLAAYGTSAGSNHSAVYSATEHCILIGLVSFRADLNYQQGVNRMWSREVRDDLYFPAFAHLGEQPVYNKEIFADGTSADDDVFGYQERFAEMRYKQSMVTGKFRSNATGSLDAWHLAQDFPSLPVLNGTFMEEDPPVDRVIATPSEPHILFDGFFDYKHARPMPTYSTPSGIGRF